MIMVRKSSIIGVSSLLTVCMTTVSALPTSSTRSVASETACSPPQINTVASNGVSYCSLPSTSSSEPRTQTLHPRVVSSPRGATLKNGPWKSKSPASNFISLAKSISQKGHKASPWDVVRLAAEAAKARSKGANKLRVNAAVSRVNKAAKPSKPSGAKFRSKGPKPSFSKSRRPTTARKGGPSKGPPKANSGKPGIPNRTRTAKKVPQKDCSKIASQAKRQQCVVSQKAFGHRISLFAVNVGKVNYASVGDDNGDSW